MNSRSAASGWSPMAAAPRCRPVRPATLPCASCWPASASIPRVRWLRRRQTPMPRWAWAAPCSSTPSISAATSGSAAIPSASWPMRAMACARRGPTPLPCSASSRRRRYPRRTAPRWPAWRPAPPTTCPASTAPHAPRRCAPCATPPSCATRPASACRRCASCAAAATMPMRSMPTASRWPMPSRSGCPPAPTCPCRRRTPGWASLRPRACGSRMAMPRWLG
ncbi:hypothetical protein D3C81_1347660 [compost metagenome]